METPETNPYTVSSETVLFIRCIEQLKALYSNIYNAFVTIHGDEIAGNIMDDYFKTEFKEMEKNISDFLIESIDNKK